eukprot:scaffold7352_cov254-Pinguiococcus_pyrenoidosus.AAC.28
MSQTFIDPSDAPVHSIGGPSKRKSSKTTWDDRFHARNFAGSVPAPEGAPDAQSPVSTSPRCPLIVCTAACSSREPQGGVKTDILTARLVPPERSLPGLACQRCGSSDHWRPRRSNTRSWGSGASAQSGPFFPVF